MPEKKMWVKYPDGAHLSESRKKPGDYSPLTRDGDNKLGHVTLSDADDDDYVADEGAPDISRLVPLALVAIAGIAAGVAGVKVAQHLKNRPEDSRSMHSSVASAGAAPAGWYQMASEATRLRYWDGSAWTNDFAHRQGAAPAIPSDWYPDPASAAQLRYWDGTAWTHHVTPNHSTAALVADWYPDPASAAQLRYWDGTAWTHHVTQRFGHAAVATQPVAAPSPDKGLVSAPQEPRISVSSAEWQELVRAWIAAGAIGEELWRRLSNAHIEDADEATLEAQREMEKLTAQQGAHRIKLMLEANPSLRERVALPEFMKFFGGGRSVLGRDATASIEMANEPRRPTKRRT